MGPDHQAGGGHHLELFLKGLLRRPEYPARPHDPSVTPLPSSLWLRCMQVSGRAAGMYSVNLPATFLLVGPNGCTAQV